MKASAKAQRIQLYLDGDAQLDLIDYASMVASGPTYNTSDAVRRLVRWALSNPELLAKMPALLPARSQTVLRHECAATKAIRLANNPEPEPIPVKKLESLPDPEAEAWGALPAKTKGCSNPEHHMTCECGE